MGISIIGDPDSGLNVGTNNPQIVFNSNQPLNKKLSSLATSIIVGKLLSIVGFEGLNLTEAIIVVDGKSFCFSDFFESNSDGGITIKSSITAASLTSYASYLPTEEPSGTNKVWKQGGFLKVTTSY